ncbi:MAG: hypothetical protein ICV63_20155 [Coleofasciculus sp. Co-bin14]|nr:hypothetical protein [Coleofasciculus sp. Co-bin14]
MGTAFPTIESTFQVLASSAHPTPEGFVESGARSEFGYCGNPRNLSETKTDAIAAFFNRSL